MQTGTQIIFSHTDVTSCSKTYSCHSAIFYWVKGSSGKTIKKCCLRKVLGDAHCIMLMEFPKFYPHPHGEILSIIKGHGRVLLSPLKFLGLPKQFRISISTS